MSASEVGWRVEDHVKKWAWVPYQVAPDLADRSSPRRWLTHRRFVLAVPDDKPRFAAKLDATALAEVPTDVRADLIAGADEILAGRWTLLGVRRQDMEGPDWFFDPRTGRTAPSTRYCFAIDHRSEEVTGNIKQIWELSRMQHVTVLAAAFALSGDERYADRAGQHLRSWWARNPFLSGVHWTSGIELGLRLISWVWARRLLEAWAGTPRLFEENPAALEQIWWHQRYLARFRSRGSSANNHVVAEAAGQLVSSLAFAWFAESERWAAQAGTLLEEELAKNTFPSGVDREMASEYHGFVAELGLLAAAEADRAGRPLSDGTWQVLCRMVDVMAATVDVSLRPARQGDGDDGKGLLLGPPEANRYMSLLALGRRVLGAPDWWPACPPDANSILVASLADKHAGLERPRSRPYHFADAGMTILRSRPDEGPEIWCRLDAGPHGFLSIAAHAHADALALEVRHNGTEILADPGTYCYNSEPAFRSYFRSTLGHNTVEVGHQDQSTSGGPTLWARHAQSRVTGLQVDEDGEAMVWSAEHDGYKVLDPPVTHRRTVKLFRGRRLLEIVDTVETVGHHPVRVAFHLGPDVSAEMGSNATVERRWSAGQVGSATATLHLPQGPTWSLWRGSTDPVLGWYSCRFGKKQPSVSLVGECTCSGRLDLQTLLQFQC